MVISSELMKTFDEAANAYPQRLALKIPSRVLVFAFGGQLGHVNEPHPALDEIK